jgi:hypothetical protein
LSGARRPDEALAPARESVALFEQLTSDVGEDHLPGLAAALACTADVLARRGDVVDALEPAERAVDTYESLVETDPRRYLEDLVDITLRLVRWNAALGRDEDATRNRQRVAHLRTLPGAERPAGPDEWCRGGPDVETPRISRRRRRGPRRRRS